MVDIHSLGYSRAIRVVWLMEDLHQPYNLVPYQRTDGFRAPDSLGKVHPLGKSPVICDDGITLAESSTILRYLVDKFSDTSHRPKIGTALYWRHEELLDYVESSFAAVAMGLLLPKLRGKEPSDAARKAMQLHFDYVADQLSAGELLFGKNAMLADIQFSYLLVNLSNLGFLSDTPRLAAYWAALQQQPGYTAAVAKAGAMAPPI